MNSAETYMARCIELAIKGLGSVAPNPMVGCVIVKDDKIIAEGFHENYGEAHAEVNAIKKLPADIDPKECTLYVNLEPCSHQGKTPPCSDLIILKHFKKVVIGNTDTNPLVAGKGIEKLKYAGIEVEQGVLEKECRELNKRFFTFHEKKRPYIILKWAQTADGFISKSPLTENRSENWITGEESKTLVHSWRAYEQGILVGYQTALHDNPQLTTRLVKGKNPVRIVLDRDLLLPGDLHVFDSAAPTIIFNTLRSKEKGNISFIQIDFNDLLPQLMNELYKLNISSVIIEGGTKTLELFLQKNLWDEARVFVNPDKRFVQGVKAPSLKLTGQPQLSGSDQLYVIKI